MLPWLSPRWLVLQRKTILFGILVYLKAQVSKAVNVIYFAHFYENFSRFTKKFLPLLSLKVVSKYFYTSTR